VYHLPHQFQEHVLEHGATVGEPHGIRTQYLHRRDLMGSGTISGSTPGSYGNLLELTWNEKIR